MNDTLSRILATSNVHELLTRDDLDTVSVKRVSESLLAATQQSVVPPNKNVHMSVESDEFVLSLHQSTSISQHPPDSPPRLRTCAGNGAIYTEGARIADSDYFVPINLTGKALCESCIGQKPARHCGAF